MPTHYDPNQPVPVEDPRIQGYPTPAQPTGVPQFQPVSTATPGGDGQPPVVPLTGVLQGLEQFRNPTGRVDPRQPQSGLPGTPRPPGGLPPRGGGGTGGLPGTPRPPAGLPPREGPPAGGPDTGVPEIGNPWEGLRGQMFMPENAEDVARLRELIGSNVEGLFNTPDRGELASGYMDLFNQQNALNLQDQIRDVGRDAAKFGRIGSGVTTSRVGDAFVTAEQNRANAERGLALDAAGHTLQDRLGALSGASGVQNMFSGQDAGFRQEQRGERGYADHLAQQDLQNRMAQRAMEEGILNARHGRQAKEAQLYGDYGYRWQ